MRKTFAAMALAAMPVLAPAQEQGNCPPDRETWCGLEKLAIEARNTGPLAWPVPDDIALERIEQHMSDPPPVSPYIPGKKFIHPKGKCERIKIAPREQTGASAYKLPQAILFSFTASSDGAHSRTQKPTYSSPSEFFAKNPEIVTRPGGYKLPASTIGCYADTDQTQAAIAEISARLTQIRYIRYGLYLKAAERVDRFLTPGPGK
jgi:hypothetical protein